MKYTYRFLHIRISPGQVFYSIWSLFDDTAWKLKLFLSSDKKREISSVKNRQKRTVYRKYEIIVVIHVGRIHNVYDFYKGIKRSEHVEYIWGPKSYSINSRWRSNILRIIMHICVIYLTINLVCLFIFRYGIVRLIWISNKTVISPTHFIKQILRNWQNDFEEMALALRKIFHVRKMLVQYSFIWYELDL